MKLLVVLALISPLALVSRVGAPNRRRDVVVQPLPSQSPPQYQPQPQYAQPQYAQPQYPQLQYAPQPQYQWQPQYVPQPRPLARIGREIRSRPATTSKRSLGTASWLLGGPCSSFPTASAPSRRLVRRGTTPAAGCTRRSSDLGSFLENRSYSGCDQSQTDDGLGCVADVFAVMGLVIDGALQAAGVALLLVGYLDPKHALVRDEPALRVLPMRIGTGHGVGLEWMF